MSVFSRIARLLPVLFAGIAALTFASSANAQTMWGGSSEWGGGRQTVSFSKKHAPGQIIVSFGDRRLYKITSRGRAISYPIAIPRNEARWQGVTNVSMKRKYHRREQPSCRAAAILARRRRGREELLPLEKTSIVTKLSEMVITLLPQHARDREALRKLRRAARASPMLLCSLSFQTCRKANLQRSGSSQAVPTEGCRIF